MFFEDSHDYAKTFFDQADSDQSQESLPSMEDHPVELKPSEPVQEIPV